MTYMRSVQLHSIAEVPMIGERRLRRVGVRGKGDIFSSVAGLAAIRGHIRPESRQTLVDNLQNPHGMRRLIKTYETGIAADRILIEDAGNVEPAR